MPHFLCFTDLTCRTTNNPHDTSAVENNSTAAISAAQTSHISSEPASEAAGESSEHPTATALFEREENKKSSFFLQQPFALFYESGHNLQNGDNVQKSTRATVDGEANADEVHSQAIEEHQNCDKSNSGPLGEASANGGEKSLVSATASISSCISSESPQFIPQAREVFLFGGFELITNVKTVEVYLSKITKPEEESYLTTCRGIPMRDLPHLKTTPPYIDGTRAEAENTSIRNQGNSCNIEGPQEIQNSLDEGTTKTGEQDTFYKFIFVSPGGPKPVERVRLKFVRSNTSCIHANSIIARTLKMKGRLSDSIPPSNTSHQPMPQPTQPTGIANFIPGIPNNKMTDNVNSLASIMAMVGGNSVKGMPTTMQISSQQQQLKQLQTRSSHQQYDQLQQNNHQQEKNHAELISSVAGLGMFLKSSEERTMSKLEMMLTSMEMRIMKRLDALAERMDVIEQSTNDSNDDDSNDEIGSHE